MPTPPLLPRITIRIPLRTTILLLASLTCTAGLEAACTAPDPLTARVKQAPGAESYTALGVWFGKNDQFPCAVQALKSALRYKPASAPTLYLLGLSLYSSGQPEAAVAPLRQSIRIDPKPAKPHLILGAALSSLKRASEAESQWQDVLRTDPKSTPALYALANSYLADHDPTAVIGLLHNAPQDEDLSLTLAQAYGQLGMLDEAAATLAPAAKADPSSLALANALATVLVHQNRFQDAANLLQSTAALHPDNLEAQVLYLRILVLNQDTSVAPELGRKLLAANPNDPSLLYLNGILERLAGDYPTARAHLQRAVALNPNDASSRYNLGIVLAKLNDPSDARDQLQKALDLGEPEPEVHFQLASVLRSLGDASGAQQQLKLYQDATRSAANRNVAVQKSAQADNELAAGNLPAAVSLYREAAKANPEDALLAYKLGMALDKTGDAAAEAAALQQAVRIDPTLALAQNQLGFLAAKNGDTAAAVHNFQLAVKSAPGYTSAWISLAASLDAESRTQEARAALANALRLEPNNAQARDLEKALAAEAAARKAPQAASAHQSPKPN